MKKLLFVALFFFLAFISKSQSLLDANFGGNGIFLSTNPGAGYDIAIQPDGKIVAVGNFYVQGQGAEAAVIRLNANGTPDNTFGSGGYAITNISDTTDQFRSVVLMPDGKIVAAGVTGPFNSYDIFIVRYNSNGIPDNTFGGGDGIVVTDILGGQNLLSALAVQPDGKILTGANNYFYDDATIMRFNADGTPDNTFSDDSKLTIIYADSAISFGDIIVQADGKLIVGASAGLFDGKSYLIRLNDDGSLDTTFDGDGIVDPSYCQSCSGSLVRQLTNGQYLLGGSYYVSGNDAHYYIARHNADGTVDNTFGTNGILVPTIDAINHYMLDLKIQTDGKLVVMGTQEDFTTTQFARYTANGAYDPTFNGDGYVKFNIDPVIGEFPQNFALNANDNIVATGAIANVDTVYHLFVAGFVPNLTSIGEIVFSSNAPVLLYPNPLQATETLNYTLKEKEQITISLIDNQGKLITTFVDNEQQGVGEHEVRLTMPTLATGTYFIRIASPKGAVSVKVVK